MFLFHTMLFDNKTNAFIGQVVITVDESAKHIMVPDSAARPGRSPNFVIRQREDDVRTKEYSFP